MTPWLGPTSVPGVTINPFPVLSSSAARGCSRPKTIASDAQFLQLVPLQRCGCSLVSGA